MSSELKNTNINKRVIFAASTVSASGAAIFLIMPLLIGVAIDELGFLNEQAGFMTSSYFAGYLLICISAVFWMQRSQWRYVSIFAYSLLISGLLLSIVTKIYTLILIAFFISGCGGGILFGLCLCILAETDDPDRYFGVKLTAEQALAVILFLILPQYVIKSWGYTGLVVCLSLVFLFLASFIVWIPNQGTMRKSQQLDDGKTHSSLPVWLGLLYLMIFMGGLSGVWAFVERMANNNGISAVNIGQALSFGLVGGGIGAFAAAVNGDKFGRTIPLILSLILLSIVLLILNTNFTSLMFALIIFIFTGLWNYSLAYQMGIVAILDASGQLTVLMSSSLALGAMIGPLIAGLIITDQSFLYVLLLAFLCIFTTTIAFIKLNKTATSPI
ncbi:MAG: hypothetical protein P8J18_09665 [Halieaceae bacterium]|nr:hypothetical protein [Halieaceae bacterium]